jgi:hypothetical protein
MKRIIASWFRLFVGQVGVFEVVPSDFWKLSAKSVGYSRLFCIWKCQNRSIQSREGNYKNCGLDKKLLKICFSFVFFQHRMSFTHKLLPCHCQCCSFNLVYFSKSIDHKPVKNTEGRPIIIVIDVQVEFVSQDFQQDKESSHNKFHKIHLIYWLLKASIGPHEPQNKPCEEAIPNWDQAIMFAGKPIKFFQIQRKDQL